MAASVAFLDEFCACGKINVFILHSHAELCSKYFANIVSSYKL